jgi:putative transposase
MRLTYKYRLYPNKIQVEFLKGQLCEAAELYNAALGERIGAWKTCRKSISLREQISQLKLMRDDGCLKITNYSISQDVLQRIDGAFTAFCARSKRGEKPGFPRFRSPSRYDSLTYLHYGNGCRLLDDGHLRIQGAGKLRVKLHRPLEGKIKTVTIKRSIDQWYVYFSVVRDTKPLPVSADEIGIDVGLTSLATLSNGEKIWNPCHLDRSAAILRRRQRKLARRKKTSKRRAKARKLIAKAYQKVQNQRSDYHHKVSRSLVDRYGRIVIEDLNIKGLAGGMLAKSVHDAGWTSLFLKIAYKAECAGRELIKVDPRHTSQTCVCGERVPKTLKQRWHHCPACGLSVDRDHMSAQVILSRAGNRPSGANVEVFDSCVS